MLIPVSLVKEMQRARKVLDGVNLAAEVFPGQEFSLVIIGTVRGNGSAFLRPFIQLFYGVWKPEDSEFLNMSITSKLCLISSLLLVVQKKGLLGSFTTTHMVHMIITLSLITAKACTLLGIKLNPLHFLQINLKHSLPFHYIGKVLKKKKIE